MSNTYSPAQALPADVLRLILKQVTLESRSPFHEYTCQVQHLKELLEVSSAWRQVALEFLWHDLRLTIVSTRRNVHLTCPKWVNPPKLPHYAEYLVKDTYVRVGLDDIANGKACKLLADFLAGTNFFPQASKLTLNVEGCMNPDCDFNSRGVVNAKEFATFLKSITGAHLVKLVSNAELYGGHHKGKHHGPVMQSLATILYTDTNQAHLSLTQVDMGDISAVDCFPPLQWLFLDYQSPPDLIKHLVHKSSSTLQYLSVPINAANMLISDAVVYPNLQYLMFCSLFNDTIEERLTAPDVTPFPALRSLRLGGPYPYDDDVLFRGNSATLESLCINLDDTTIANLCKWQTFDNRHKVLQAVSINAFGANLDTSEYSKVNLNKFMNSLLGGAKWLSIPEAKVANVILKSMKHGQEFQNINVLEVHYCGLSLFEILCVLKAFPALVELVSRISGLGPELEDIPAMELPNYVTTTFGDAGKSLQKWRMCYFNRRDNGQYINYLLLLAMASPKLYKLEIMSNTITDYHARVSKALESEPFSKYASQLSRLLTAAFIANGHGPYA